MPYLHGREAAPAHATAEGAARCDAAVCAACADAASRLALAQHFVQVEELNESLAALRRRRRSNAAQIAREQATLGALHAERGSSTFRCSLCRRWGRNPWLQSRARTTPAAPAVHSALAPVDALAIETIPACAGLSSSQGLTEAQRGKITLSSRWEGLCPGSGSLHQPRLPPLPLQLKPT